MSFWWDREKREIERVFLLSTNQRLYFRRHPPHGFWRVSFEAGSVPEHLSGDFTNFKELYDKVEYYLKKRRRYTLIREEVTDGP